MKKPAKEKICKKKPAMKNKSLAEAVDSYIGISVSLHETAWKRFCAEYPDSLLLKAPTAKPHIRFQMYELTPATQET